MKINWKVRIKNPVFWATVLPAFVSFCYCLLGAMGVVAPISENEVLNVITALLTALTALGVLVDPTTAGVFDSNLAMTYSAPRKDSENAG